MCMTIVIISCFYKLFCLAGECGDIPPGGKLSCYLLQHNPLLWQQLIKRNVIRRYLHEAAYSTHTWPYKCNLCWQTRRPSQTELIGSLNNSHMMIGSCSLTANLYSTKSNLFPLLIAIFSVWKQKLLLLISHTLP